MTDRPKRGVATQTREARGRSRLSAEPRDTAWADDLPLGERAAPEHQIKNNQLPVRRSVQSAALVSPVAAPPRQTGALPRAESQPRQTTANVRPPAGGLAMRSAAVVAPRQEPRRVSEPVVPTSPPRPQRVPRIAQQEALVEMLEHPVDTEWSAWRETVAERPPVRVAIVVLAVIGALWLLWGAISPEMRSYTSGYRGTGSSNIANTITGNGQAQPVAAPGQHSIVGSPTVSADQVERVLEHYGSPAAGTGAAWVRLGQRYNIDPAYALAFFIHESTAGTAQNWAGVRRGDTDKPYTYNIGNIICAGYSTCYGRFRDYPTWEAGIEDWYRLLSVEYIDGRGITTLEDIIPVYAPAFENDVDGYINVVEMLVEDWRRGVVR